METMGQSEAHRAGMVAGNGKNPGMTLSRLRHDIRNHLNTIKLSCALLQRRKTDELTDDSVREIGRAVDNINELVTRFMGDADAPSLLLAQDPERRVQ